MTDVGAVNSAERTIVAEDLVFPSGKKLRYIFAVSSEEISTEILDEIEALKIMGPLRREFSPSMARAQEHLLSRTALLALVRDFRKRHVGGVSFSLSHTRSAALVAGRAELEFEGLSLCSGVGVDLERRDRKISQAVRSRLVAAPLEESVDSLSLWCLKEACFKAHPENGELLMTDFRVELLLPATVDGRISGIVSSMKSGIRFEFICFFRDQYFLALSLRLSP